MNIFYVKTLIVIVVIVFFIHISLTSYDPYYELSEKGRMDLADSLRKTCNYENGMRLAIDYDKYHNDYKTAKCLERISNLCYNKVINELNITIDFNCTIY